MKAFTALILEIKSKRKAKLTNPLDAFIRGGGFGLLGGLHHFLWLKPLSIQTGSFLEVLG
jgi:hypothetical protein